MKKIIIILLFALLCAVSCTEKGTAPGMHNHGLKIVLNTGIITKTVAEPDSVVADGGGIYVDLTDIDHPKPDLIILVFDNNGDIAGVFDPDSDEPETIDGLGDLESGEGPTAISVTIDGLGNGPHTVYAFANTQGSGAWAIEERHVGPVADLTALTTASQADSLIFTPLAADTAPTVASGRMPITAKGSINLSDGNGELSLNLTRCVAKVTAEFINRTGAPLTLTSFETTIIGMCPTSAYVLPGNSPDTLGVSTVGTLIGSEASLGPIANSGSISRSWYVFPTIGPYTCNIHFTYGDYKEFTGLEVHDDHGRNLTRLQRNQHLHIVTTISQGQTVSFNFEVAGWGDEIEEEVEFN